MTTPATELRKAAEKLRATAGNATEGPWAIWRDLDHQGYITVGDAAGVVTPPALQSSGACNPVAHVYVEEDAEHIALMHSGVGLALADWLEAEAGCLSGPDTVSPHALALARQVLGTTGEQPETDAPTDFTETANDAARRFARRLHAVEQLCAGRPGYHTVTVKALLTAMSDADDDNPTP